MFLQNQVQKNKASFFLTNFQLQVLGSDFLFFFFFLIVWSNSSKTQILIAFIPWVKVLALPF